MTWRFPASYLVRRYQGPCKLPPTPSPCLEYSNEISGDSCLSPPILEYFTNNLIFRILINHKLDIIVDAINSQRIVTIRFVSTVGHLWRANNLIYRVLLWRRDAPDNHGGIVPTIIYRRNIRISGVTLWRRDRACPRLDRGALCLSGGTTGDVVTSAGDD